MDRFGELSVCVSGIQRKKKEKKEMKTAIAGRVPRRQVDKKLTANCEVNGWSGKLTVPLSSGRWVHNASIENPHWYLIKFGLQTKVYFFIICISDNILNMYKI